MFNMFWSLNLKDYLSGQIKATYTESRGQACFSLMTLTILIIITYQLFIILKLLTTVFPSVQLYDV